MRVRYSRGVARGWNITALLALVVPLYGRLTFRGRNILTHLCSNFLCRRWNLWFLFLMLGWQLSTCIPARGQADSHFVKNQESPAIYLNTSGGQGAGVFPKASAAASPSLAGNPTNKLLRTLDGSGLTNLTVINVKDYGAIGDFVTDDYTAIKSAISAAEAVGGGNVYFPATTTGYLINAPTNNPGGVFYITKGCSLTGDKGTRIKLEASPAHMNQKVPLILFLVRNAKHLVLNNLFFEGPTYSNHIDYRLVTILAYSGTSTGQVFLDSIKARGFDTVLKADAQASFGRMRIEVRNCDLLSGATNGVDKLLPASGCTFMILSSNTLHVANSRVGFSYSPATAVQGYPFYVYNDADFLVEDTDITHFNRFGFHNYGGGTNSTSKVFRGVRFSDMVSNKWHRPYAILPGPGAETKIRECSFDLNIGGGGGGIAPFGFGTVVDVAGCIFNGGTNGGIALLPHSRGTGGRISNCRFDNAALQITRSGETTATKWDIAGCRFNTTVATEPIYVSLSDLSEVVIRDCTFNGAGPAANGFIRAGAAGLLEMRNNRFNTVSTNIALKIINISPAASVNFRSIENFFAADNWNSLFFENSLSIGTNYFVPCRGKYPGYVNTAESTVLPSMNYDTFMLTTHGVIQNIFLGSGKSAKFSFGPITLAGSGTGFSFSSSGNVNASSSAGAARQVTQLRYDQFLGKWVQIGSGTDLGLPSGAIKDRL